MEPHGQARGIPVFTVKPCGLTRGAKSGTEDHSSGGKSMVFW